MYLKIRRMKIICIRYIPNVHLSSELNMADSDILILDPDILILSSSVKMPADWMIIRGEE